MHSQSSSEFLELLKSAGKRFQPPGTRVTLRRNPGRSLGVAFGTRGVLRRSSEGVSRCGLRDTWHAPKEFRRGLSAGLRDAWHSPKEFRRGGSWFGHSGHVAHSECIWRDFPDLGTRARGTLRMHPEG